MEFTIDQVARVCHETNVGYQAALNESYQSQPWSGALLETRETTKQGVRDVLAGLSPRECHRKWVEAYKSYGWIYGTRKDEFNRTHPCLVPFEDLPEHVKVKNTLFAAVVRAMADGNQVVE